MPLKGQTKELQASLQAAMSNHLKQIGETLDKVDPEKRIEFIIRLMPYLLPKDVNSNLFDLDNL